MTRRNRYGSLVLACVLSACNGSDAEGTAGSGGSGGTAGTGGTGGAPDGLGSATLTIGDETWKFDSFDCAFGYDATQTNVYVFSSSAFGEHSNGARVQMQAEIEDDTGGERYEGAGVIYTVYINDIENFENPSVDWQARGPAAEIVVKIDGDHVTAEGVFDDQLTELEVEQTPGMLDASCSSRSIR